MIMRELSEKSIAPDLGGSKVLPEHGVVHVTCENVEEVSHSEGHAEAYGSRRCGTLQDKADARDTVQFLFLSRARRARERVWEGKMGLVVNECFSFSLSTSKFRRIVVCVVSQPTAPVELDGTLKGNHHRVVPFRLSLGVLLHRDIEVGHVGVVVLGVVNFHDLPANHRLESAVIVSQVGQLGGDDGTSRGNRAGTRGPDNSSHDTECGVTEHDCCFFYDLTRVRASLYVS